MFFLLYHAKGKKQLRTCKYPRNVIDYQAVIFMNRQLKGSLTLLLATIIWGSTFVAQSVGMDHIGPFTFQAVRCFLAVAGLVPVIAVTDRFKKDEKTFFARWLDKKLWKTGLLCGIPLFFACNLQQLAIVDTDAGKAGFLTAMYIVFVPIMGIFLGRKATKWIPLSVLLGAVGLYCLSCAGVTQVSTGDLLLLGCAVMFALQIIFVDIFGDSLDSLRLNWIQSFVCAVLSTVVMFFTETPDWQSVTACWFPLCYAGLLSMGAAYSLQIIGQKFLPPTPASLIMSLESVFAVLFGCLILRETLTIWETLGCVLVFAAVILSQLPDKKAAATK